MYRKLLAITLLILPINATALDQCHHFVASGPYGSGAGNAVDIMLEGTGELICKRPSKGTFENVWTIRKETNVLAAILDSDVVQALTKRHQSGFGNIRLMLPVATNKVHVISRQESGYKTIEDLVEKLVCVGTEESGSHYTAMQVSAALNLSWVDVNEGHQKCFELLDQKHIDAIFLVDTPPVAALSDQVGKKYSLLSVPTIPGYSASQINEYKLQQNDSKKTQSVAAVPTISSESLLVVDENKLNQRLKNKIAMAAANIIVSHDIHTKDRICTGEQHLYGLKPSSLLNKACKLGFTGLDW